LPDFKVPDNIEELGKDGLVRQLEEHGYFGKEILEFWRD
jgi:hypothetical protein